MRFFRSAALLSIVAASAFAAGSAAGQQAPVLPGLDFLQDLGRDRLEISQGAGGAGEDWFVYAGLVVRLGPVGKSDGWLLRLDGVYGQYAYESSKVYELRSGVGGDLFDAGFGAQAESYSLMLGHQWRIRDIWLRLYAGAAYDRQTLQRTSLSLKDKNAPPFDPDDYLIPAGDPDNPSAGGRFGGRAALGLWAPVGADGWASVDASYASANAAYSFFARAGYSLPAMTEWLPRFTLGPEFGAHGDEGHDGARAGMFLRFEAQGQEITVSGGVAGDYDGDAQPYLLFGTYRKF
jgi:hypothetical protein